MPHQFAEETLGHAQLLVHSRHALHRNLEHLALVALDFLLYELGGMRQGHEARLCAGPFHVAVDEVCLKQEICPE